MDPSSAPVAALDLGTNTALLLVARRGESERLEVVEDRALTARLGQGLAATGRLDPVARERTRRIVGELLERATALGVPRERCRGVGTAVFRRAADGAEFAARLGAEFGFEFRVLSEEQEAQLGHAGVAPRERPDTVVLDVGGGSTELVSAGGLSRLSAPIGALLLTEAHLAAGSAPVDRDGWRALLSEVRAACAVFPEGAARGLPVMLIGGTAVNLAALESDRPEFSVAGLEGRVVALERVLHWTERLARSSLAARAQLPVEGDRIEILPAGLACLAAALTRIGAARAQISLRGLRHGLARQALW